MKKTLLLVTSLLFGAALVGCQTSQTTEMESAEASMKTITGTVAYRERIALPPNAVVTVTLEDVSLADAPSKLLAKQTFETEGKQVPLIDDSKPRQFATFWQIPKSFSYVSGVSRIACHFGNFAVGRYFSFWNLVNYSKDLH